VLGSTWGAQPAVGKRLRQPAAYCVLARFREQKGLLGGPFLIR
jgi:hypothetical protein